MKNFFSFIKNKYLIAVLVFLFFMLFYDHNNIFVQMERRKDLSALEKSKKFYTTEIAKTRKELDNIQENPAALERYAREHLYMQRDSETVFIVDSALSASK